ncbi:MAG: hypothetical protein ACR2MT_06065 [Aurantibacter sp.]
MRKLSIILVALGMASLGFAQNSIPNFDYLKYKDLGTLSSNYEYLNEVQNGLTPNQIKYLENVVSYWDVTKSEKFDGRRGERFNVTFKSNRGQIIAYFDRNGKVVRAKEQFRNFALPKQVGIALAKKYPNWTVIKNRYTVLYTKDGQSKKIFKVQISKDKQKKWLKIDPSGRIS